MATKTTGKKTTTKRARKPKTGTTKKAAARPAPKKPPAGPTPKKPPARPTPKKPAAGPTPKKPAARPTPKKEGRTSLLDAAAAVLAKADEPMSCPEIVEAVLKAGTWKTSGKTPAATLSAAIHREIREKENEARFAKAERGRFRLTAARAAKGRKSA